MWYNAMKIKESRIYAELVVTVFPQVLWGPSVRCPVLHVTAAPVWQAFAMSSTPPPTSASVHQGRLSEMGHNKEKY